MATNTTSTPPLAESDDDGSVSAWFLIVPHFFIAVLSWLQTLLALNRLTWRPTRAEYAGLGFFGMRAIMSCLAAVAAARSGIGVQLCAALVSALFGWAAFLVIYNGEMLLPTMQQWNAAVLVLVISGMWEASSRLMVNI